MTTDGRRGMSPASRTAPLPAITGCTVTTQPPVGGTGPVVWTLDGFLSPSAAGTVTYSVTVPP